MKRTLLATALLSVLASGSAFAGTAFVMPEVGYSRLAVDEPPEYIGDEEDLGEAGSLNLVAGYKFDSNMVLGASAGIADSGGVFGFGIADSYTVDEYGLWLGYAINIAPHFRVVPAIGINRWGLDSDSSWLLDPLREGDQEEQEISLSGTDPFWRVNLEFPVNRVVQLNLSYQWSNYDFGELQSTRFGVKFEF